MRAYRFYRGNGDFKKSSPDRIVYPISLQFCTGIEGDKKHNKAIGEFLNSFPEKFGGPLNFSFALQPMGRKISNRLYWSF